MTQEELVLELTAAVETISSRTEIEPGTITRSEYQASRGVSEKIAARHLQALANMGRIERVHVKRANAWGAVQLRPGFKIKTTLLEE
jgi:CTP-dependent riboflavin kinase